MGRITIPAGVASGDEGVDGPPDQLRDRCAGLTRDATEQ
jgi:hypothetical protein